MPPTTVKPPATVIYSLNQTELTARKAVRGAGLPWGLADDAGKAVRWLHARGLGGVAALAALLAHHDYTKASALGPVSLQGVWRATGGVLDPLLSGASLSDCFAAPEDRVVETATMAYPLLAAGFIGNVAEIEDRAFTVTWPQVRLQCRGGNLRIQGTPEAVDAGVADFLGCQQLAAGEFMESADSAESAEYALPKARDWPPRTETRVDAEAWSRLEEYARRTYVKGSAASRLAGAGAGLQDND